jgi:plastocyanin
MVAAVSVVSAAGLTAAVTASAHSTHAQLVRPAASKGVTVTLHNFQFNPMTVTIKPGTTVTWKWEDGAEGTHNLTPLKKKGGLLFKGTGNRASGTYSVTFTKAGTYYYECSIHPLTMQAKIIVK